MWSDALKGAFWGGLIGAFAGLGVCIWLIDGTLWFPGDTILIGVALGAIGGFFWGEPFLEFLRDHWHLLTWW